LAGNRRECEYAASSRRHGSGNLRVAAGQVRRHPGTRKLMASDIARCKQVIEQAGIERQQISHRPNV